MNLQKCFCSWEVLWKRKNGNPWSLITAKKKQTKTSGTVLFQTNETGIEEIYLKNIKLQSNLIHGSLWYITLLINQEQNVSNSFTQFAQEITKKKKKIRLNCALCVHFQSKWKYEDIDLLHQSQPKPSVHTELDKMNTEPLSAITFIKFH